MKCFNKLFNSCPKSVQNIQKCYYKRKFPLDRTQADSLPVFQYPVANPCDKRVYVSGLAETGALGLQLPNTSEANKKKNALLYAEYPKRISFGEKHNVKDITSGYGFTAFAIKSKDCFKVFGTGLNTDSQIGYQAPRRLNPLETLLYPAPITLPLQEPETTNVISLSAGRAHLLIATDNEGVYTLGNNAYGQCGRKIIESENYSGSMVINKIHSLDGENIVSVQCGQDHSMFITETGKVYACGWGSDGQLGRGDYATDGSPTRVIGDIESENIIKISCAADCVLALSDRGEVFGWGNTEYGQLNSDNNSLQQMNVSRAIKVCDGLGKIIDIASGGSFCMVLNENGDVYSWGYGILGMGPQVQQSFKPLQIPATLFGKNEFNPDSKVTGITCGIGHMAAIADQGDLYTWGKNKHGCLGLGHSKDQFYPLKVSIGARVLKVACGIDHTIYLSKAFV